MLGDIWFKAFWEESWTYGGYHAREEKMSVLEMLVDRGIYFISDLPNSDPWRILKHFPLQNQLLELIPVDCRNSRFARYRHWLQLPKFLRFFLI